MEKLIVVRLGKRSARVGRNPKTGEAIKIATSKTAKFSAGKEFKDSVNKRKKSVTSAYQKADYLAAFLCPAT